MVVSQWRLSLLVGAMSIFSVLQLQADSFDGINTDIYQSILSSLVDVNPSDMPNAVRDIVNVSATNKKNYSRLAEPAVFKSMLNRLQQKNNGKSHLFYASQFKRPLLLNTYSQFGSVVSTSANKAYSELLADIQDPYRFQKITSLRQGSKIPFSIPNANSLFNLYTTDPKLMNYENCEFLLPHTKVSPNSLQNMINRHVDSLKEYENPDLVSNPDLRKKILGLLERQKRS